MSKKNDLKIGAYGEYQFNRFINMIIEINYSQKGSSFVPEDSGISEPVSTGMSLSEIPFSVNYFEFPVLLKILVNTPISRVYLSGGIRYDYQINDNSTNFFLPENDLSKSNWGFVVATGLDISNYFENPLSIEIRYNHDTTPLFDHEVLTVTNSTIDISVGVTFKSLTKNNDK